MKKLSISYMLVFVICTISCQKDTQTPLLTISYENKVIEGSTNSDGKIIVKTSFPDKDIVFDIKVVDDSGNPVESVDVTYNQIGDKSIIFVKDQLHRYSSAFLYGPPIDLDNIAGINDTEKPETKYEAKSVLLTIGLLITIGSIAAAEIRIIKNAYVIQKFYITDQVLADKDYILYCKTFGEIADLIKSRTGIVLDATSILISFVGAGKPTAVEISKDILMEGAESIRDKLLNLAIDIWGKNLDEVTNRCVAVRVYPFDRDENFANIKNLYALYEIDYNNTICDNYINDVPFKVNDILTREILTTLENRGLLIYKGFTPPDVSGNYYLDNLTNLETGTKYINYSYQFFNQNQDFSIELKTASSTSDAIGKGAFISGEQNGFSIYCETEHNINDDGTVVYIKSLDIFSGTLSSSGIESFQNGFIIVDKTNDPFSHFMEVGDSRIVYEADGLASKVSTFPYTPTKSSMDVYRHINTK